jgi:hypothetical protein
LTFDQVFVIVKMRADAAPVMAVGVRRHPANSEVQERVLGAP